MRSPWCFIDSASGQGSRSSASLHPCCVIALPSSICKQGESQRPCVPSWASRTEEPSIAMNGSLSKAWSLKNKRSQRRGTYPDQAQCHTKGSGVGGGHLHREPGAICSQKPARCTARGRRSQPTMQQGTREWGVLEGMTKYEHLPREYN